MKFLFLNLMVSVIITLWSGFDTIRVSSKSNTYNSLVVSADGIIVMEDEVMLRTDTNDSNDTTEKIDVYSLLRIRLLSIISCQSKVCYTDLSLLPSGNYRVVLTTVEGKTYETTIIVASVN